MSLAQKKIQDPEWYQNIETKEDMSRRSQKKYDYFIILPDDSFKGAWDILIMLLILFVCVTAPARIAFTDTDNFEWIVIDAVVDSFFFIDLVLNFFMAYHDEEYTLIDDRKVCLNIRLSMQCLDIIRVAR